MPRPFRSSALRRLVAATVALAALIAPAALSGQAGADVTRYATHAELTAALQALAKAHPTRAALVEIGRTRGGRTLQAIQIAAPGGAGVATRPGVLVVGNLEGDGLLGSMLALAAADALLTSTDRAVAAQLASTVFYIVPRVNADGAEAHFDALKTGRRTNLTPFDDDNDGRVDEDGPEDLDKDGLITMMRVKNAAGPFAPHRDDARLMKRADPQQGEAGGWQVYWEGIDNDSDGFLNEDGPGGTDLDRNFPHQYPYYTPDAGPHMVSEPETRALLDYVLAHRNIAVILTLAASDNLVSPPTARGELGRGATIDLVAFAGEATTAARGAGIVRDTPPPPFFGGGAFDVSEVTPPARAAGPARPPAPRPATTVNAADVELFRHVSDRYRALTGIRQLPAARRPAGAFFEWGYFQFGVPAFSSPGWGGAAGAAAAASPESGPAAAAATPVPPGAPSPVPPGRIGGRGPGGPGGGGAAAGAGLPGGGQGAGAGAPGAAGAETPSGTAADDLRLLRWLDGEQIDAFVPWTAFTHPTLGAVEIGGFRPYAATVPPAARLPELAKAHTAFILELSTWVPRLAIPTATVTALGAGLYRIKAEIENRGRWPTATQHGVTARAVKPVMVQLGVEPSAILSGAPKTNFLPTLAGSGRRQVYEWIVKGTPGQQVTVRAVAQKGGSATETVTLK